MSIEIIGKEVLPNLYVKSVIISKGKVEITVAAFDYMDKDGKVTWMSTEFVRNPKIKMNCITTKEGSNIDQVFTSSNDYSLYNVLKNISTTPDLAFQTETFQFKGLNSFDGVIAEKLLNTTPDSYIQINHTFGVRFDDIDPLTFNSMRCYCFFSYDPSQEEDTHFIDSTGQDKKLLVGPIFSEIIIENGSINQESNFYTIDGSPYAGPVHSHNNMYMEGSFHEAESHRFVDVESVRNTKIYSIRSTQGGEESIDSLSEKDLATPTNSVSKFFGNVSIGVGDKKLYGFFKFRAEEFFRSNPLYNYFVDSFASFNVSKIRNKLRMKLVSGSLAEDIEIKEIIINSIETNDMFFYFEIPFEEYTESSINIRFDILNTNSMFVNTLHLIRVRASNSRVKITPILETQLGDTVTFTNPNDVLDYIKNYCTLVSMFYDIDLESFRAEILSSLYKSKVPRNIITKYDSHFLSLLSSLIDVVESNPSNPEPIGYSEEKDQVVMQLQNYKNSLVYFHGTQNILVHPDIVANALINSNLATAATVTQESGLFSNLEQIFLPRFIRRDDGMLQTLRYNDISLNDSFIKVFEPSQSPQIESEGPLDFVADEAGTKFEAATNKPEVDENSPGNQAQQYV